MLEKGFPKTQNKKSLREEIKKLYAAASYGETLSVYEESKVYNLEQQSRDLLLAHCKQAYEYVDEQSCPVKRAFKSHLKTVLDQLQERHGLQSNTAGDQADDSQKKNSTQHSSTLTRVLVTKNFYFTLLQLAENQRNPTDFQSQLRKLLHQKSDYTANLDRASAWL